MAEDNQINCVAVPRGYIYHFDFDREIEESEEYTNFFTILREASPEDVVYIHINSPGGRVDTTVQIVNAIATTDATVVTCAEGLVASAAALVFFSGQAFQVGAHCEFLIHTGSCGQFGKLSDHLSAAQFANERIRRFYEDVLGGFLTEEELQAVSRGEEFFLFSEDVAERIQRVIETNEEEQKEDE